MGRVRNHSSADQSSHTLSQAVLWLLQRKTHSGKSNLCFPKNRGAAQSVAFPGWSSQFLSFPVVVRGGEISLVFQQIGAPAGILPLQLLLSCSKYWECCHFYQKGGRMVLLCLLECTTAFQLLIASWLGSKAIKHCKLEKNTRKWVLPERTHSLKQLLTFEYSFNYECQRWWDLV